MSLFEEVGKAYEGFKDEIYLDHEKVPTIGVGYNLRNSDVLKEVLTQFGYSVLTDADFNSLVQDLLEIFRPTDWTEANKDDKISEINDLLKEYKEKMDDAADKAAAEDTFVFKDKDGKSGFEDSSIPKTANEMEPVFTEAIKDFEKKAVDRIQSLLDYDDVADAQAVWDGLDQSQKDSLLSLVFNGGPRIMGPKLAEALRDKNWADAYFEIVYGSNKVKDYDGDGKADGRSYGLQLRRTAEGAKFIEGLSVDEKKQLFDKLKNNKATIEKYLDAVVDLPSSGGYRELSDARHDKLFNDLNALMDDLRSDLSAAGITVADVDFKSSKVIYSPHLNDVNEPSRIDPVIPKDPVPPTNEGPKDPPPSDPTEPPTPSTPPADPLVSIKETQKDGYTLIEVYFNDDSGTSKILMAIPDTSPEGAKDPGYLIGFPSSNDHIAEVYRNAEGTLNYRFIDKTGKVATDLRMGPDKIIDLEHPVKGENGKWIPWGEFIKKKLLPDPPPPDLPPPPPRDPLALDLNGDGVVKTLPMSRGIHFDLDNSGFAERTSWVAPEDGLLVLDRNNNNFIDGGAELFGTETLLETGRYAAHGFEALAEFDTNKDGVVDSKDTIYSSVRVWRDANSNGVADSGELKTLGELNIKSIATSYTNINTRDANNVEHREAGAFTYNNSTQGITNTLWFESDRRITKPVTELQGNLTIPDAIKKLPNAVGFGNTHSLHHAMTVDTSGELQKKVQRFSVELDPQKRRTLLREILVLWTNTGGVVAGSRGTHVDATSLAIMESFWGQPALQDKPFGEYASATNKAYQQLEQSVYTQLMSVTHMGDLLSLSAFTEVNGNWSVDYSVAADFIMGDLLSGNEFATIQLLEFVEVVRGINPYSNEFVMPLLSTIITNASALAADQRDVVLKALYAEELILNSGTAGGSISGDNLDNLIYGSLHNDQMSGHSGSDVLVGESGHDHLDGGDGDDHLVGGVGNDFLYGGAGNDSYHYRLGDGNDRIYDLSGTDEIALGEGILPKDIVLSREGWYGLKITFKDGGTILIDNMFNSSGDPGVNAIEGIRFSNNEFWSLAQIKARIIRDSITEGNDIVEGFSSEDVIQAGGGFDQLRGKGGNDRYIFNRGDGVDVISDAGGYDTLVFGPGINSADVIVHQHNGNFYFIINNGEMVQVSGSLVDGVPAEETLLERVEFSGGEVWDKATIQQKVMETLANPNLLMGKSSWDHLNAGDNGSVIYGLDGNDQIYGGIGNDTLIGGGGLNFLDGGRGDDTYLITEQPSINFIEKFRDGFDRILFAEGITPEDVAVKLIPGRQESYLQNGVLWVYSFSQADNWNFEIKVGDAIVYLDSLLTSGAMWGAEVKDPLLPSGTIEFFDGTEWTVQDLLQQAVKGTDVADQITGSRSGELIYGLAGDDAIYGLDGADTIDGGEGNDTLTGGYGEDVLIGGKGNDLLRGDNASSESGNPYESIGDIYRFSRGDGNDTIEEYFGRDIIEFGAGIAKEQVVLSTVGNDTVVSFLDSPDSIVIKNGALPEETFYSGGKIEVFKFANGDEWNFDPRASSVLKEGGDGNDTLVGGYGNDTLVGHRGDDRLRGDLGNDSYHYNLGDGFDSIIDVGGFDQVIFGSSITSDMVKIRNDWSQAIIISINGNDALLFEANSNRGNPDVSLEKIVFSATNESWDQATIFSKALQSTPADDEIYGTFNSEFVDGGAGNDRIDANDGNDTLVGGTGSDNLFGGMGDDVYRFSAGDGSDSIKEDGGFDTIQFTGDIIPTDITAQRTETDLILKVRNANPITIYNFFGRGTGFIGENRGPSASSAVENIQFANGASLSVAQLLSTLSVTGNASANFIYGLHTSELIDGKEGNDSLYAGGGNDTLLGGTGNDNLYGEIGDDLLRGGDGDDRLEDLAGNNVFEGGKGNDSIFLSYRNEGQGLGTATIRYGLGDGIDTIYGPAQFNLVELGAGITRDMVFLKSQGVYSGGDSSRHSHGFDIYIKGTNDKLIGLIDNDQFEIVFADNSVLKGAELQAQVKKSTVELSQDRKSIIGKTDPGLKLLVSYRNQDNTITSYPEIKTDAQGNYSFNFGFGIRDHSRITVVAVDNNALKLPITVMPPQENLTVPDAPLAELDSSGYLIKGIARPGTYITVATEDRHIDSVYADVLTGIYTIESYFRLINGEKISVTASVNTQIQSVPTIISAPDITAPKFASGTFNGVGTNVSGSAEKSASVLITDLSGTVLGSTLTNAETGAFTVNLSQPLVNSELVHMVVRDAAGNSSTRLVRAPDITAPTVIYASIDKTRKIIKGFAEPGATVVVRNIQGDFLQQVTASPIDGAFEATLGNGLAANQAVNVKMIDIAGNASAVFSLVAGTDDIPLQPQAAFDAQGRVLSGISVDSGIIILRTKDNVEIARTTVQAGASFNITLAKAYQNQEVFSVSLQKSVGVESALSYVIAPDKKAPNKPFATFNDYNYEITGYAEPHSKIQVIDGGNAVVASIATNADGSFFIRPNFAISESTIFSVVAIDQSGNISAPLALIPKDRFTPIVPTGNFNDTGTAVSGTAEAGSVVFVQGTNDQILGHGYADTNGYWSIELTEPVIDGSSVSIVSIDSANNRSGKSVTSPDLTVPLPATAQFDSTGKYVYGEAEWSETGGNQVVVMDSTNTVVLGSAVLGSYTGSYKITLATALKNNEAINVIVKDVAGNVSTTTRINAPDKTAPLVPSAAFDTTGKIINGIAEAGSTVIVKNASGAELKTAMADAATGAYTLTLNTALINKETVSVTARDAAGNISTAKSIIAPDLTPPTIPSASIDATGKIITGTAENGSTVIIKNEAGVELKTGVANASTGAYSITLTTAMINKESLSVTARDNAGNVSAVRTIIAPDKTPPSIPTASIDSTRKIITGAAEPGSVVEVKNTANAVVGSATANAANGSYTINLATALAASQTVNVTAKDSAGNVSNPFALVIPGTATPNPASVIIEAENYTSMYGVVNETTTDVGGGRNTGNINTGDWMAYNNVAFNVPAEGRYKVTYRVASLNGGGRLALRELSNDSTLGSVVIPKTSGWQNWVDVTQEITLSGGAHNFKIYAESGGFNVNWFKLEPVVSSNMSLSDVALSMKSSVHEGFMVEPRLDLLVQAMANFHPSDYGSGAHSGRDFDRSSVQIAVAG